MTTTLGIAVIIGAAITLLVWGGQDWLHRRYRLDVAWLQENWLRFNPNPVDAGRRVLMGYGVALLVLAGLIFVTPHPIIGIVFWVFLLALPRLLVQALWTRRRAKIDRQLPAAISAMSNAIKAGLTLLQAMQRLAEQAPEPIRTDFRVMVNRYACGASLEATIREAKDRLTLQNFNLFASALLLNREMGGDISETLARISRSLDKLHEMRKTVEAHTSEGRTNIKVLLVAPVLMLMMISTMDAEGVKMMFTTPQGYGVLLVAGSLIGTGIYFASKITNTEI